MVYSFILPSSDQHRNDQHGSILLRWDAERLLRGLLGLTDDLVGHLLSYRRFSVLKREKVLRS